MRATAIASSAAIILAAMTTAASAQTETEAEAGADMDNEVTIYLGQLSDAGGENGTVAGEDGGMTVQASLAVASEACGVAEDILQVWNQSSTGYCVAVNATPDLDGLAQEQGIDLGQE